MTADPKETYDLSLTIEAKSDGYLVSSDWLRIYAAGETLTAALHDFASDLEVMRRRWAELSDDEITGEAVALKRRFACIPRKR